MLEVDSRTPNRQYGNGNMFLEVLEAFLEFFQKSIVQYSES